MKELLKNINPSYEQCRLCKYRKVEKISKNYAKILNICKLYKTKCANCNTRHNLEIAHIVPRSVIRCDSIFNLVLLCHQCHSDLFHKGIY